MRGKWLIGAVFALALFESKLEAQNPFAYFAGNPAHSWSTITGNCNSPMIIRYLLFLESGDITTWPSIYHVRWTALPFQICAPITFDQISYTPLLGTGDLRRLEVRVIITGARTGSDGHVEPDLNNVIFWTSLGPYQGDPPTSGQNDEPLLLYNGETPRRIYLRTNSLGQSVTLAPGLYFAIIAGDEDYANPSPSDSFIALMTGAPGGPKLYYIPSGLGTRPGIGPLAGWRVPHSWERFRHSPAQGLLNCSTSLNTDLPWRNNDPFADSPPWNTLPSWNRYHSPALYHGVLGFRNSQAAWGKVVGTAVISDTASMSDTPLTNVEVIFYLPGTKHRVARFSMPANRGGTVHTINTPAVVAGVYDVVVRPLYLASNLIPNCPTNTCIQNVTYNPNTHWLGVRIPSVNVAGTVDLGNIILPNGDTNGDLAINDTDLLTVLFSYSTNDPAADLNGDNLVDEVDLLIVLFNFGIQGEDGDEDC